ncbi:lysylphosphatidylglycerol synthase domain-containing protein [Oleiagrimonas citrea]|uniref:Uncharacterized protein n=1 Tax=Oleiagrimonas citrea TaxID=1665687 RepID=A0A846ZL03_9GAMM|nr:lysylphosphatidylglycerol synthase domain-containing protein [Oleiagrimonas citrea]NKZ38269.1 hypothetical protein [Oleiagrimonas citrea]
MKRVFRLAGIAIALATGVFFILYAKRAIHGHDLSALLQANVIGALITLVLLYVCLIPITALAWTWLLRGLGQRIAYLSTLAILAVTQFGKYMPGNVAQHIGRLAMARRTMPMTPVVLSMTYETLLTIVACAHVATLTLLWAPHSVLSRLPLGDHRQALLVTVTLGALIALSILPRLASKITHRRLGALHPCTASNELVNTFHPGWKRAASCYAMYVLNFLLIGIGLWWLSRVLAPVESAHTNPVFFAGAFAASWVLGFLAPGAPAGLGVREALLTIILGTYFAPASAVILIVSLRIATTLGDLLNFCFGFVLNLRLRKSVSPHPSG